MVYIFKDRLIRVEWTIYKGISPVKEDFSRSNVKVFLLGNREKYLLQARADKGTLYVDIPSGLEEGTYSIEAIWVKNMDHVFDTRSVCRSKKEDLFSITEFEDEATNIGEGVVVLKVKTSTATYGYDGLSSYELAVLRGDWNGTEGEWLKHERYVSVLDSRGDSEVDTMSQKAITDELEAQDNAIEDIRKDTEKLGDRVEEAEEKVNNMGDVVDEIKSHAPVSARPAGFKPDIDLTPEITVDRAWRDHEGNVIRDTYITRRGLRNEIIDITNQQVTDLKPGSVDPDDLSEATKQLIGNKSITNLPDEEDITVTENQTLKLKDKEYAPKDYSGMGRVYLRKHYVNGVNTLTQHMMRKPNTIYIIQYDYCLAGQTIEVPENCVLRFEGGSLRNGVLNGNHTEVYGNGRLFNLDLNLNGSFNVRTWSASWYGVLPTNQDNSPNINHYIRQIHNIGGGTVLLGKYEYVIKSTIYMAGGTELSGTTFSHPYIDNPDYQQQLTKIICDFENTDCWAIDSDCYKDKECTSRFSRNDFVQVSTPIFGKRKGAYALRNIYIKCNKDKPIYGGIRTIDCTYGTLQDIITWYFKVGMFVGVGWFTTVKKISNNFGYIGIVFSGITTMEISSLGNTQRYISGLNDSDIFKINSSSTGYEEFKYSSIGILIMSAYVNLINVSSERVDYGSIIDHSIVTFETPYIEYVKKSYFFGVGSNKVIINNMTGHQPDATEYPEYGVKNFSTSFILNNAHGGRCNIPVDSKYSGYYSSKCYIINQFNIDCRPYPYNEYNIWKYSNNPYIYYTNGFEKIFVSSSPNNEDGFGTFYLYPLLLDTALERLENSLMPNYKEVETIELKEDCSISSLHRLIGKKVTIDGKTHTLTMNIGIWLMENTELYIKNCTLNFNSDAQFLMQDSSKLKLENVTVNKSYNYDAKYPIVIQRCSGSYVKAKNCVFNGCQVVTLYSSSNVNLYFNDSIFNIGSDNNSDILNINSNSRKLTANAYFEKCTIPNEQNIMSGVSLVYYGLQDFIIQIDNKTYPYRIDSDNNNYTLLEHNIGTRVFDREFYQNKFWSGSTWVDDRGRIPHRRIGTTEQRPNIQGGLSIGSDYYDTTIKKPLWWNGMNWVDATGATV